MAGYNFLRESSVHIVYGGSRYLLRTTPNVTVSQTFSEDAYEVKTLHNQSKMFQGAVVTKANPADFTFEVHLTTEKDESIVLDLLTDYDTSQSDKQLKSFDMYLVSSKTTFKMEGCIITEGNFELGLGSVVKLAVSGQGKKLSRVGDQNFSLPGSLVAASSTRTPHIAILDVELDGTDIANLISSTLSVQNNIEWTPYRDVHSSLSVTDASNAMYPDKHTISNRVVSGNIRQYLTDNSQTVAELLSFDTDAAIRVKSLKTDGTTLLDANLGSCVFTNRLDTADALTASYDFRLVSNPSDLGTIITY